jgi:predicted nucleic acid-binding protein
VIFVDTSALYAVADAADAEHQRAAAAWQRMTAGEQELVTTNYVLNETIALVQRRSGLAAAVALDRVVRSVTTVVWVDLTIHEAASATWAAAGRRDLSLTDCVSFLVARQHDVDAVFAYDRHFAEQGFRAV